jgi:predicted ATP-dependent serine protease
VNADGHIAGVRAVEHEADVVLDVEAMHWRLRKSRYQETGMEGDVRLARAEGEAA